MARLDRGRADHPRRPDRGPDRLFIPRVHAAGGAGVASPDLTHGPIIQGEGSESDLTKPPASGYTPLPEVEGVLLAPSPQPSPWKGERGSQSHALIRSPAHPLIPSPEVRLCTMPVFP